MGVAPVEVFAGGGVAEPGDACAGEDVGHQGGQLGGEERLDVVGRHEQAGVHCVVVGAGGARDGVDALFVVWALGVVERGGGGEGKEADVGFLELGVDLGLARGDLFGRHQVGLGEEDDDVGEGGELAEVFDVDGPKTWKRSAR